MSCSLATGRFLVGSGTFYPRLALTTIQAKSIVGLRGGGAVARASHRSSASYFLAGAKNKTCVLFFSLGSLHASQSIQLFGLFAR